MRRTPPGLFIVSLWLFAPFALSTQAQEQSRSLLGFTPTGAKTQLRAEEKFKQSISTQSISDLHRLITARPHMAGTGGGKAVADAIAEKLRSFGLAAERDAHTVYLSYPRRLRLRLLGPRPQEIPLAEPVLEPDETAGSHQDLPPGFVAYSASGKVRGPVVYANYGLPGDYDALRAAGVEVNGAIVLVRYGRVHRAVKVFNAEQRGARGIVIYSDPADDGHAKGATWPAGPWRHPQFIQRGNAKYSWYWHGDPLTPGYACGPDCLTRSPQQTETLPKIPVVAISSAAAQPILRALLGAAAPAGFQGGLPFVYRAGPGGAEVELDVEMENGPRTIYNVVGRIPGSMEADRWVILGTHHDAWTYGGVDPGSACAVLLELARALGAMHKEGWRPKRTIVFGFWDAEELGLIGSTEFAERHANELREKAVAYINSDLYMAGGLRAGGTASLRNFVAEVARDVASPAGGGSVYTQWRADAWKKVASSQKPGGEDSFVPDLDVLGSGADFVPFQAHLGIPALSIEFGGESYGSYGVYHSNYDTRWFMEKFGDPGWRYGPALVEMLGRTATRLASADVLPYRYVDFAQKLDVYLQQLERENADSVEWKRVAQLSLPALRREVARFREAAVNIEEEARLRLAKTLPSAQNLRVANERLARLEQSFAMEEPYDLTGPDSRWFRHTLYGWNIYALYAGQTLPGLHRAVATGDAVAYTRECSRLAAGLDRAIREIQDGLAALRERGAWSVFADELAASSNPWNLCTHPGNPASPGSALESGRFFPAMDARRIGQGERAYRLRPEGLMAIFNRSETRVAALRTKATTPSDSSRLMALVSSLIRPREKLVKAMK
jgi:N-acetylated-alpha-linked acidic dipeptidase